MDMIMCMILILVTLIVIISDNEYYPPYYNRKRYKGKIDRYYKSSLLGSKYYVDYSISENVIYLTLHTYDGSKVRVNPNYDGLPSDNYKYTWKDKLSGRSIIDKAEMVSSFAEEWFNEHSDDTDLISTTDEEEHSWLLKITGSNG